MSYSLAVDIGGTFTDAVLRGSNGTLVVDKTLTTHHDLLEGFFRSVDLTLAKAGISADAIDGVVVHATTVVTNALIERKGQPTALITTKGFRDVLPIRNEHRYEMYDPQIEFAEPLIPRRLTFEVDERVLADGGVLRSVDVSEVEALAAELKAAGVTSVAICLINAFRNGANEQAIAEVLRAKAPGLYLSLSSTVAPQIREYPRASTTAINAYTTPITEPYLRGLSAGLREANVANRPLIMLSSGGVIGAEVAGRNPVRMIESGPAAGALAAAFFAERLGLDRLLSFDMGGTTAKACLIEDRKPLVTGTLEVDRKYRFCEGSGMPLTIPSIDMIEIGAGGGSIAYVDDLGLLKVGPQSAGSQPGPACYGRGGTNPTVTDADLVLGLLDAKNFLGGDMPLDKPAAEAAIDRLGAALGVSRAQTAGGIYRVVAEAMAGAARAHATDRGVDHRGLPLLAFGGAGPVHACAVGELLQSAAVIFPPQASVLSAFGALVTPVRLDLVRSALSQLDCLDWAEVHRLVGEMKAEAAEALGEAGVAPADMRLSLGADLRYAGQQNEVSVAFEGDPISARDDEAVRRTFENAYFAQYGVNPSHVPVEVVSWRLTAQGPEDRITSAKTREGLPSEPKREIEIPLWAAAGPSKIYDRAGLTRGQTVFGPALIEERETTVVLPPNWRAIVDDSGCIIATRTEERERLTMDGIELEILWSNLIGIVSEQAKALQRIAFSPIVREAGDLASGLFDARGRMVAQANTGTPGHINSLAAAGQTLANLFHNQLVPGDIVITNDPWMSAGHFFDITVLCPIFWDERLIGYIGSTIHHTDIGGYGIGAGARDIHEEGLWIPPLKFYEAGVPNATLHDIIRSNVRTPDHVFGDLSAQVSSGRAGGERLIALCKRQGLRDIEALSDEIINRSEAATRNAVRALPSGTWHGASSFDVPGGDVITLKTAVTVDNVAGEVTIDFDGSSGASPMGINVVMNYTHAYSTFAVRSCLNPEQPNNVGSLSPIKVKAPEGSIINAKYPSPVNARHVVGMFVPMPILKALHQVIPERVLAEGSGAVWTVQIQGKRDNGEAFTSSMFNYSGGMGARLTKPGPSATCYPTGVAAVPVEVLEASMPIVFDRRELRLGSGGQGRSIGGDGQIIGFHMRTHEPWLLNAVPSRLDQGPEGLGGGEPGAAGRFLVNGKPISEGKKMMMQPGDVVLLETPGGGGYGPV